MAGSAAGFDPVEVAAALRFAMQFGMPSRVADQPTFYLPPAVTVTSATDDDGIPFNPDTTVDRSLLPVRVDCAYEYIDVNDSNENWGVKQPSKVTLTLMDVDYQQIKGFSFVVIAGQKYNYRKTEPAIALGSLDFWTLHCQADDEL